MSQSLAQRLQQSIRTLELLESVVRGPASGGASEVQLAPGVRVRTLARRVAEMTFGLENVSDAEIEILVPQDGEAYALRGLAVVAPLAAQIVGPNIRLTVDLSACATDEDVDALSDQLAAAVATLTSQLDALDAEKAAVAYVDAGLAGKVSNGAAVSVLGDGGGFVRMTDAERAKLATLAANYKGAYASLAALAAAVPAGSAGDWAILTHGVGVQATFASWDSDNTPAAWIDTNAGAPTTIDWGSVTGRPATFPPSSHTHAIGDLPMNDIDAAFVGMTGYFPGNAAPTGWLKKNGALVSRTTYARLWAFASASGNLVSEATWSASSWGSFGQGDGATTFRLPDDRGEFVRGWDDGRGVDSSRAIGTPQTDAMQGHRHAYSVPNAAGSSFDIYGGGSGAGVFTTNSGDPVTNGTNGTPRTAGETRPRNIAMLACIKY